VSGTVGIPVIHGREDVNHAAGRAPTPRGGTITVVLLG
jgi:hypothetical protein